MTTKLRAFLLLSLEAAQCIELGERIATKLNHIDDYYEGPLDFYELITVKDEIVIECLRDMNLSLDLSQFTSEINQK